MDIRVPTLRETFDLFHYSVYDLSLHPSVDTAYETNACSRSAFSALYTEALVNGKKRCEQLIKEYLNCSDLGVNELVVANGIVGEDKISYYTLQTALRRNSALALLEGGVEAVSPVLKRHSNILAGARPRLGLAA